MNNPSQEKTFSLVALLRILAGLLCLPLLPFVSAFVWQAGTKVVVSTLLLVLTAYLVFFFVAIGWGAVLLLLAILWCAGGSLRSWRQRRIT